MYKTNKRGGKSAKDSKRTGTKDDRFKIDDSLPSIETKTKCSASVRRRIQYSPSMSRSNVARQEFLPNVAKSKAAPPTRVARTRDGQSKNEDGKLVKPSSRISSSLHRGQDSKNTCVVKSSKGIIAPRNYTVRPVIPAKKAELLPVARAMHREDFAPRVKKLFDPEREAALQAIESGIYVGFRCPEFTWDCIRVSDKSRCFCDHSLGEHESYTAKSINVKCLVGACACKSFSFVPERPEDIGEWWLPRRPGFDYASWRAKCRCKHSHNEHSADKTRKCRMRGCSCFRFESNFLCAACDRHWEDHGTFFDGINSRQKKGLPYGEECLPFHELPDLRNIVLTGEEDNNDLYNAITTGPNAIPRHRPNKLALQLRGSNETGQFNR